jgi:hypothetical protein
MEAENRGNWAVFDLAHENEQGILCIMAASSKLMIGEAERRFPVRLRLTVPPEGLGSRRDAMSRWLDATCGADGWAMTPSGLRGIVNDAVAIYFRDASVAGAFVARWCQASPAAATDGAFLLRVDELPTRAAAPPHRTPQSDRAIERDDNIPADG